MARPKKYLTPVKDFHIYLDVDLFERVSKRATSLNLSFVGYVQKVLSDDIIVWEHEQRQALLKSLKEGE